MDIFTSPALLQQAIEQGKKANDVAIANLPILSQVAYNARQSTGNVMDSLGAVIGREKPVNPIVQQAIDARQAIQGVDMTSPEGMLQAAKKLNQIGMPKQALALSEKAKKIAQNDAISAAQYNNSMPKPPAPSNTEKVYELIKRTQGDKAANKYLSSLGEGRGVDVNVASPDIVGLQGMAAKDNLIKSAIGRESAIKKADTIIDNLQTLPGLVGMQANLRETGAGLSANLFGIFGNPQLGEKIAEQIESPEFAQARSRIRQFLIDAQRFKIDESRITDTEREMVNKALGILDGGSYNAKALQGLLVLRNQMAYEQGIDVQRLKRGYGTDVNDFQSFEQIGINSISPELEKLRNDPDAQLKEEGAKAANDLGLGN
jgi:hypothetical protein